MPGNRLGRGKPEYQQQPVKVSERTTEPRGRVPENVQHRIRAAVLKALGRGGS